MVARFMTMGGNVILSDYYMDVPPFIIFGGKQPYTNNWTETSTLLTHAQFTKDKNSVKKTKEKSKNAAQNKIKLIIVSLMRLNGGDNVCFFWIFSRERNYGDLTWLSF